MATLKKAFVGVQVQGPLSFMVSWGKDRSNKNALAISWNTSMITNIEGISEKFARISYYGLGSKADSISSFNFKALNNGKFAITTLAWSDFGATYSRVLIDKGAHMLKGGITGKIIIGEAGGYVSSNNIDYKTV